MKRAWCAIYQWPGKKEFLFGTVFVDVNETLQVIEEEIKRLFIEKWHEILPNEYDLPELKNIIPGELIFQSGEYNDY